VRLLVSSHLIFVDIAGVAVSLGVFAVGKGKIVEAQLIRPRKSRTLVVGHGGLAGRAVF